MKTAATLTIAASMLGTMVCSQAAQPSCSAPVVQNYLVDSMHKDLLEISMNHPRMRAMGMSVSPEKEKETADTFRKAITVTPTLITTLKAEDNMTFCQAQR